MTRTALTNADLSGANLTATNLTDAALTGADVTGAVWSNTTCPDGTVESAPCTVISFGSPSSVRATTNAKADTLLVDIDPDLPNGDWLFSVEQRTQSGGFVAIGSFTTHGSNETAIINLPADTYRVFVPQQHAHAQSISAVVALTK